jgi:hypothetical protein
MIVDGIQISTFIPKDGIPHQTELSKTLTKLCE